MAEAATADEKTTAAPVPAPALPIKLLIIVVLAALVAGLGGAFVIIKVMGGHNSGGGEASDEHKADGKSDSHGDSGGKQAAAGAPGIMFDLDPFIVNLADSPDIRYLKLTIKLEVENEAVSASLSSRIPQLRDTILVLLSSKDSATIRTPQGKFQLRDEITARINWLLPKPGVKTAYFTDLVVQ